MMARTGGWRSSSAAPTSSASSSSCRKEWVNAPKFQGLIHDKDPIAGDHDGTYNMTIQHKPIKKTLHGLPRFTTVKGGAYVLLPGLRALRSLANA